MQEGHCMRKIMLCILLSMINPSCAYVMLPQPNNITTFELDPTDSNAGWKNLIYCLYDATDQNVQCLPDAQQNNTVYKRSNLTETTSLVMPRRTVGDTGVLVGIIYRYYKLDPNSDQITRVPYYIWKMRYENPQ